MPMRVEFLAGGVEGRDVVFEERGEEETVCHFDAVVEGAEVFCGGFGSVGGGGAVAR